VEATAAKEATLAVGDHVYRTWDPGQEPGTIVAAAPNKAQWIVSLARGKTWIYHSNELALVES